MSGQPIDLPFTMVMLEPQPNGDIFKTLQASALFEPICKGRKAAIFVDCSNDSTSVPIVRTTTAYKQRAQKFGAVHARLAQQVENVIGMRFNNIMIEHYTWQYSKMAYHSDQALDLQANSYIALYSCYSNAQQPLNMRTLIVKNKATGETHRIALKHNSVVFFDLDTNERFMHKIVVFGGAKSGNADNDGWIGLTMRVSKTFVHFDNRDESPRIGSQPLLLANEQQQREFRMLKSRENKCNGQFEQPSAINFTLSPSDLLKPAL